MHASKICPRCGLYMNPYMINTDRVCWRCVCGYDTGSASVMFDTAAVPAHRTGTDKAETGEKE